MSQTKNDPTYQDELKTLIQVLSLCGHKRMELTNVNIFAP